MSRMEAARKGYSQLWDYKRLREIFARCSSILGNDKMQEAGSKNQERGKK